MDTNTTLRGSAALTGSILNNELLTVGADADNGANKLGNTAIDDLQIYTSELDSTQVSDLFN